MIEIRNNIVYSTGGRTIHRLGTDIYFASGKGTAIEGDTPGCYEEVDGIPACTETEYSRNVEELIRERYSLSAELAILRQRDTKPDEFAAYNAFAEECKRRAKAAIQIIQEH